MDDSTTRDRAVRAAEEIAAAGQAVTARSVRERSGVRMNVATAAAREWNAANAEQADVPEIPDTLRARFDAVWREAFTTARAEFNEARAGWANKVAQAEAEVVEMTEAVDGIERQLEQATTDARDAAEAAARMLHEARESAATDAQRLSAEVAVERSRADRAEGALAAVTAERDRLLAQTSAPKKG